jgi:hypothetical protein
MGMAEASGSSSETIKLKDSLDTINRVFYRRGWTDGLPIIPPTRERVEEMMEYACREPEEVVAAIPPKYGEATVEKLAANAVMAGCRPEYFPVIVAAIEALMAEEFNLYGIQTTTHVASPLILVSGPIAGELDINGGYNVFGQGWMANATIGRAVRLALLNIGGAVPGVLDRATFGHPGKYSYCMTENDEANPWEPLHVEMGYAPETSTVTVIGAEAPHNINDHVSTDAEGILTTAAFTMCGMGTNSSYLMSEAMLVLGPEHAHIIAAQGWGKPEIRRFIFETARHPLGRLKKGGMWGMFDRPQEYDGDDDDLMVPILRRPEDLMIAVAGGSGRHSVFVPTFGITRAVTRPISLKDGSPAFSVQDFRVQR